MRTQGSLVVNYVSRRWLRGRSYSTLTQLAANRVAGFILEHVAGSLIYFSTNLGFTSYRFTAAYRHR